METKKIVYGGRTLELPAGMTLEEAKAQMARFFPELSEPEITTTHKDGATIYTFSKKAGRKGGDSLRCPTCGELKLFTSHRCPPRWQYCLEDDGDDWQDIYASDENKAAEKAAAKEWNTDYRDEIIIWVRKPDELTSAKYPVDVESEPVFNTRYVRDGRRETRQLEEPVEEE